MTIPLWMLLARIGLMVCLYGFLSAVLFLLWRDIQESRAESRQMVPAPAQLHWLEAPAGCPENFLLTGWSTRIGRSRSVEVCLRDDTVSVVHARVWYQDGRWWLEDLGSKNNTLLNEIPLVEKTVLTDGDRIRLGRCQLEFNRMA
jgi:pSer/pThr/pTyr-binding forkhead associated (FHA) protein